MKSAPVILLLAMSAALANAATSFGCVDDNGHQVDWWLAIKSPDSFNYIIATSNSQTMEPSTFELNGTTGGALANTLNQIWATGSQYVAYNDEPPTGEDVYGPEVSVPPAHAKGVMGFGSGTTNFFITHSIPLFPVMPDKASTYQGVPDSGRVYAQDLFCVTLSTSEMSQLAGQYVINGPDIYSSLVGQTLQSQYVNISNLVNKKYSIEPICQALVIGNLTVFGKTSFWDKDLWDECVSVYYKTDLFVETWIRGDAIGPSCPPTYPYTVLDAQTVTFNDATWKETQDHSKWAVGVQNKIVCWGDINRMTTQYKVGGGATCSNNPILWAQFSAAITTHATCP